MMYCSNIYMYMYFSYSSSSSGNVIEVDYQSFSLKRVWQLFPDVPGGVAITSLYIHEGILVGVALTSLNLLRFFCHRYL